MNNIFETIKQNYKYGSSLTKLIYFNVAIFVGIKFFVIIFRLFNVDVSLYLTLIAIPANTMSLLHHFWTPLTYMFVHEEFMHLIFNMFALYWFGKIFLMYFSEKQLLALYLFGGLVGALIFVLSFNLFPYYKLSETDALVIGASGSIVAIIVAAAVKAPNSELRLLFIGKVKMIYIAIATVLISFFGITGENSGGEMVHVGGALAGYLFVVFEKKGNDITLIFNKIIDFFVTSFRKREPKLKATKYHSAKMSDGDYNRQKAQNEAEIDTILDKIKTSGYESLTANEKRKLFDKKK